MHTVAFLTSEDATKGRAARMAQYKTEGVSFTHVVWAERQPNLMVELDAEDEAHARRLANAWIEQFGAMSASMRSVKADGSLPKKCEVFSEQPEWEFEE